MEPLSLEFRPGAIEPLLALADDFLKRSARAYELLSEERDSVPSGFRTLRKIREIDQCFYSNLIEGITLSRKEIAFSADPDSEKSLAGAHLAASRWADKDNLRPMGICQFLRNCHEVFVSGLPDDLRFLNQQGKGLGFRFIKPGRWREMDVQVGHHVPPRAQDVQRFMDRFEEVYSPFLARPMTGKDQLMAIVHGFIAHHRLVWIHPFSDFNGRISRIFLDKWLAVCRLPAIDLRTISGLLGRDGGVKYLAMLHNADRPRQGALDGRGNLTEKGLVDFVRFCLEP